MARSKFVEHYYTSCIQPCDQCGEVNMSLNDLFNHMAQMCPKTIVPCDNEESCQWSGPRKDLSAHLASCSATKVLN